MSESKRREMTIANGTFISKLPGLLWNVSFIGLPVANAMCGSTRHDAWNLTIYMRYCEIAILQHLIECAVPSGWHDDSSYLFETLLPTECEKMLFSFLYIAKYWNTQYTLCIAFKWSEALSAHWVQHAISSIHSEFASRQKRFDQTTLQAHWLWEKNCRDVWIEFQMFPPVPKTSVSARSTIDFGSVNLQVSPQRKQIVSERIKAAAEMHAKLRCFRFGQIDTVIIVQKKGSSLQCNQTRTIERVLPIYVRPGDLRYYRCPRILWCCFFARLRLLPHYEISVPPNYL